MKEVLGRYLGRFALVEARGWRSLPTKRDTDVRSGAFNYIRGTHRKHHPRRIRTADLPAVPASQIAELTGQGVPMLEPRHVVFRNYHDPSVRLQKDDIESYRYHPLLLNAAFLGNLTDGDRRILGFGDKTNYRPAFERPAGCERLHRALSRIHDANLRLRDLRVRVLARVNRGSTSTRP